MALKPKDEVTEMNQALALWDKGDLDPKTLLTLLDFPDPQVTAENVVLWSVDKNSYMQLNFPELMQKLQAQIQSAAGQGGGATGGGVAPEAVTEPPPPEGISLPPVSASLSQVPLPK